MRFLLSSILLILLSQTPAALAGCAIQPDGNGHVTIPDGQTSIANSAFDYCTALTSVTIPDSVTSIGDWVFASTGLTSLTIPDSVTTIGIGLCDTCTALTSITWPDAITTIPHNSFRSTGLTSFTISDSVTSIGQYAFKSTGLTSITIPNSVTSIGKQAFVGLTLTSITISDSVTSIGNYAFSGATISQVCGVDVTQAPFSDHSDLQVQTTQAQCTEPVCPAGVSGVKWCMPTYDCSSPATTGAFGLTEDCQLSGEVSLSGDLDILGVPKGDGSYPVITAASSSRHFSITSGAHKLTLKYLKMVDGDVSGKSYPYSTGGSIFVYSVAAHLNISHCVFFNNRAYRGGAISAIQWTTNGQPKLFFSFVSFTENNAHDLGGAVFLYGAELVDHSSIYTKNTAGNDGGALYLDYSTDSILFGSSLVNNTAGKRGGGIYITGDSSDLAELYLSSVTLQSNKQIGGGTSSVYGGGGLYLEYKVIVNIRESAFIENEATEEKYDFKHGHQIMTRKSNSLIPSVAIVNTKFTHITGDKAFYDRYGYPSPKTCTDAATVCTVAPFTGTCTDLSGNEGVTCDYDVTCPAHLAVRSILPLPPPEDPCECPAGKYTLDGSLSCLDHTTCGNQTDETVRLLIGASSTEAGTCEDCDSGSYAPDGATSCQAHTTCGNQVDGTTTRLTGASSTTAGTCADCDSGSFAANATDDCLAHKTTCPDNEYLSGGTTTADKDCLPCAADEKSYGGAPCKKVVDCLTATEQGHKNIDVGYASGDYTVSMS